MSESKRAAWVQKSLKNACTKLPDQVCTYKKDGKTEYADFNELMAQGGSHSGLSMSGDIKKQLENACVELTTEHSLDMEDGYTSVKRPQKYAVRKELCVELTEACGKRSRVLNDEAELDENDMEFTEGLEEALKEEL
eukprot:CAMPEP_0184486042 /NCGR_PEP_ID=MMETSP0113_2-20130426/7597_1 /TAXON_ID=91329 /ORGANISM="Norrisiella sphaerica, Strain BC52" /LENGTH=136 /DNA_ID=CAMNT_0026867751 /DNA_START=220 /DNA_END=630 /DNA_ORIENTATION=+